MDTKSGFVAMLDILGFSEQIARDSEVHGLDKYVDTVVKISSDLQNLKVILFSDTVVFYTLDDSPESFLTILKGCSHVIYSLLKHEIAVRGAVAHGPFRRS